MMIRRLIVEIVMVALSGVQCAMAGDSSVAPTAFANKLGWFAQRFSSLKWEEVAAVVKSPRDICVRVRNHVRYQEDLGDEHSGGPETWDRQFGDCEDLAACVLELCETIGVEASIMVFRQKASGEGHAVTVGLWNGKLWLSSNGWYTTVDSLDEAKAVVSKEMHWRGKDILTLSLAEVEKEQETGNTVNIALSSRGMKSDRQKFHQSSSEASLR